MNTTLDASNLILHLHHLSLLETLSRDKPGADRERKALFRISSGAPWIMHRPVPQATQMMSPDTERQHRAETWSHKTRIEESDSMNFYIRDTSPATGGQPRD